MRVLNKVMLASVVALTSTLAFAQTTPTDPVTVSKGEVHETRAHKLHQGKNKGMRCAGFATKGLNLSDAQQAQFKALCQQITRKSAHDAQIRTQRHAIMTAEKFDEAAARSLFEKINSQRIEQQLQRAKVQNQMYNLLTPEQKAKVDQRFAAHQSGEKPKVKRLTPANS